MNIKAQAPKRIFRKFGMMEAKPLCLWMRTGMASHMYRNRGGKRTTTTTAHAPKTGR
jgi:hypothetical protein